jgi:hypothetical protein
MEGSFAKPVNKMSLVTIGKDIKGALALPIALGYYPRYLEVRHGSKHN